MHMDHAYNLLQACKPSAKPQWYNYFSDLMCPGDCSSLQIPVLCMYIHARLFNFSLVSPLAMRYLGPNFGDTSLAHQRTNQPSQCRIRSLSIGLGQNFLCSSSHSNAMRILIVNASHVAKWGLFPGRYRDDITEAIKMHEIPGARVLILHMRGNPVVDHSVLNSILEAESSMHACRSSMPWWNRESDRRDFLPMNDLTFSLWTQPFCRASQ